MRGLVRGSVEEHHAMNDHCSGYGNGTCDGVGEGDGYGNGQGDCDGVGEGDGYGNGRSDGFGYGDCYGNGVGNGDGDGNGIGQGESISFIGAGYESDGKIATVAVTATDRETMRRD